MAATIVGARATIAIPLNRDVLCIMGDMRQDLIEHFMESDGMTEQAATTRADEALRIDPAEWARGSEWLKEQLKPAEGHERQVLQTMQQALQLLQDGRV